MNVAFFHTISPSVLTGQGRIKELIDAMGENDRKKALALLLEAEKKC